MRTSMWFAALGTVVSSCASVGSDNVNTGGIQAGFVATSDGDGSTRISGTLQVGYDFVKLSSGDSLTISAGGQSQAMTEDDTIIGSTQFTAQIGTDAPGTVLKIALNRSSDSSAPDSTVALPSRFTLVQPPGSQTFSRTNDDLVIRWDTAAAPGETMTWASSGTCTGTISNAGGSTGTIGAGVTSVDLPKGTFIVSNTNGSSGNTAAGTCSETITVTRQLTGTIDSAFAPGSSISAQRIGSVTFNSTP